MRLRVAALPLQGAYKSGARFLDAAAGPLTLPGPPEAPHPGCWPSQAHSLLQLDQDCGSVPPDQVLEAGLQAPQHTWPGEVLDHLHAGLPRPPSPMSPWAYEMGVRYSHTPGGAMWTSGPWELACS